MNPDDLTGALRSSVESRVSASASRPDLEDFLRRMERRRIRHRQWVVAAVIAVFAVGGLGGFLIGRSGSDGSTTAVFSPSSGAPRVVNSSDAIGPVDEVAARAAVVQAFRDAYDGASPPSAKRAATQNGDELQPLSLKIREYATRHGYTSEQLAGTAIDVTDVSFIDAAHAAVRFSLTIPGHGAVMVDRVGYAVFDGDRWRVSLRTACDLLSLGGLLGACTPT